jgi:hypothetical protein
VSVRNSQQLGRDAAWRRLQTQRPPQAQPKKPQPSAMEVIQSSVYELMGQAQLG